MNKALYTILLLLLSLPIFSIAQTTATRTMSLEQVIEEAQGRTRKTTLAKTRVNNRYWNYTAFKGSFKPFLSAEATLPDFNRSISRITLPDGSDAFISRSLISADAGLNITQIVPSLGTRISLYSGVERIDILDEDLPTETSYFSSPISIAFQQPIFQHNAYKWDKKIQPLIYEEAQKRYVEDMELIAFQAVNAFFDFYIAQLDFEATDLDKSIADSLYVLSQGRFKVGQIAETDLMQIELNVKTSESAQAQAKIDLENSAEELRQLLNIQDEVFFKLIEPKELTELDIDIDRAIELAKLHRSTSTSFQRRMLEAQKNVDQATKSNGLNFNLSGRFGLSQTAETLSDSYKDLLDQERLALSLEIPIADWGRSKAEREIAASELELTRINIEQEKEDFEREIDIKIRQLALLKISLDLAKSTYELAQKRLDISRKRYYIGKIEVLDLNQAIVEKENSRTSYYQRLRNYYSGYYELRLLTLYDFLRDERIEY